MKCFVICAVVALSFAVAAAGPVVDEHQTPHVNSVHSNEPTIEESLLKKLNNKCSDHDISSCMMLKLVTYFNRMLKKSQIDLGDVEITQTSTETTKIETSRSLKDVEQMSEEAQLSQVIGDKLYDFVRTRSMKWHVTDGADVVLAGGTDKDGGLNLGLSLRPVEGAVEEGRKKKDQGGNMQGIIAAAILKIGLLKALAFKALVLLVGKALLVSKLELSSWRLTSTNLVGILCFTGEKKVIVRIFKSSFTILSRMQAVNLTYDQQVAVEWTFSSAFTSILNNLYSGHERPPYAFVMDFWVKEKVVQKATNTFFQLDLSPKKIAFYNTLQCRM